jgi:GH18 family chitinase
LRATALLLASSLVASLAVVACAEPVAVGRMVVAYVPNWLELKSFADTIDYAKLTHINIAFANPADDAGDLSFNEKDVFIIERARARGVKVLISIGGGAASSDKVLRDRYARLLERTRRGGFVTKIAAYVAAHHFDGLDVDIEGPSINDGYGDFVADLHATLRGRKLLLTAALSRGYGGSKVPDSAFAAFDFVNVMAYDATGHWDPRSPGQHSSLDFAEANVKYWLDRGLPKSKIVLGVPFYGYGFGPAYRKRDYPYSEIVAKHPGAENADQAGDTIWYNGIPTIRAKARYVTEQGLAGVMIWSLDYDVKGKRSLLDAIHEEFAAGRPASAPSGRR